MALELTAKNFKNLNSSELIAIDGGDFYDGFMKVCEYTYKGGLIAIGQAVIPVPLVGAAVGEYVADATWNAVFN